FHALLIVLRVVEVEFGNVFLAHEELDEFIRTCAPHAPEREIGIVDDDGSFALLDHRPVERHATPDTARDLDGSPLQSFLRFFRCNLERGGFEPCGLDAFADRNSRTEWCMSEPCHHVREDQACCRIDEYFYHVRAPELRSVS